MATMKPADAPIGKDEDDAGDDIGNETDPALVGDDTGGDGQSDGDQGSMGHASDTQRRGPNVKKEVVPFAWKLLGVSRGAILTLFKSVEREETEAQLERVRRDGYYTDLRIVENDYKIRQSPAVKTELKQVKADQGKKPVKWGSESKVPSATRATKKSSKGDKKKTVTPKNKKKSKTGTKSAKAVKPKKSPANKAAKARAAKKKPAKSTKARTPKTAKKTKKKVTAPKPRKKKTTSSRKT